VQKKSVLRIEFSFIDISNKKPASYRKKQVMKQYSNFVYERCLLTHN